MAERRFWKGFLNLSLVTCPIALAPARSDGEKVKFHTINRATGNEARFIDEGTGKPVVERDQVKAYPVSEDKNVLLADMSLRRSRSRATGRSTSTCLSAQALLRRYGTTNRTISCWTGRLDGVRGDPLSQAPAIVRPEAAERFAERSGLTPPV
jgi:hypothetical protein